MKSYSKLEPIKRDTLDGIPFWRFANEPQELRSWQGLILLLCQINKAPRQRARGFINLVLRTLLRDHRLYFQQAYNRFVGQAGYRKAAQANEPEELRSGWLSHPDQEAKQNRATPKSAALFCFGTPDGIRTRDLRRERAMS